MDCMSGMAWMHGGAVVLGLLLLLVLGLGTAALVKYLRST